MGLILCDQEPVKHPYYVTGLGLHIYSSQELCYVIYQYPLLALDNFVTEDLLEFIKNDLGFTLLATKLERSIARGDDVEDLLVMILQECDYYLPKEIVQFQKQIITLQGMNPVDYAKLKADSLVERRQYRNAIEEYERMLKNHENHSSRKWCGSVWNNLGIAYARLFQFDKALEAFEHAFDILHTQFSLKQIYALKVLKPDLKIQPEYLKFVSEVGKQDFDQSLEMLKNELSETKEWKELEQSFEKDSDGEMQDVEEIVNQWKQTYRRMI